jgi:gustatory receptor
MVLVIMTFLIVYWIGLVESFWSNRKGNDNISVISNWIQLIINGFTLAVVQIYPIAEVRTVENIKGIIVNFDAKLAEFGIKVDYKKINLCVGVSISLFILFFIYMAVYDFYVSLVMYKLYTILYWFITFIPLMVYSSALCFAFCILIFIYYRLKIINKILRNELSFKLAITKKSNLGQNEKSKSIFLALQSEYLKLHNNEKSLNSNDNIKMIRQNTITKNVESGNESPSNLIPNVFHLLHDLVDLGSSFQNFFGPIFLSSFTSIFIVTTIQIYYCYTILYSFDETRAKTLWTFVSSINVVIVNVVMVFSLTSICESIANQV